MIVDTLLHYFLLLIITMLAGMAPATIFKSDTVQSHKLIVSLAIGSLIVTVLCSWASYVYFPIRIAAWGVLLLLILSAFIALGREWRKNKLTQWVPDLKDGLIIAMAIFSGLLVLWPIIKYGGFFPYGDMTYISTADYLIDNSIWTIADPNPYSPWKTQPYLYQAAGLRMGAQFFMAFASVIFGQTFSILQVMPVMAVAQAALVLAIWVLSIQLKLSRRAAMLSALAAAFHADLLIHNIYAGFISQAFGLLCIVLYFSCLLEFDRQRRSLFSCAIAAGLMLAAVALTYSELLPFAVLSSSIFLVWKIRDDRQLWKPYLRFAGIVMVFSAVFGNVSIVRAIKAIQIQMGGVVGSDINISAWHYWMMLLSLYPINLEGLVVNKYPLIYAVLTMTAAFFLCATIRLFLWNDKVFSTFKIWLCLVSSFIGVLVYSVFFMNNPWVAGAKGQTWNIFKLVQYFIVFACPVFGVVIDQLFDLFHGRVRRIFMIGLCSAVLLNLFYVERYAKIYTEDMRKMTGNNTQPLAEYFRLRELLKNDPGPINLVVPVNEIRTQLMMTYLLRDREILADWSHEVDMVRPYLKEEYRSVLFQKQGTMLVFSPNDVKATAKMAIVTEVCVFPDQGFYELETDGKNTWLWAKDDRVTLRVLNNTAAKQAVAIRFEGGLIPAGTAPIEAWYDGAKVSVFSLSSGSLKDVRLLIEARPGDSRVELRYSGPRRKGVNDSRPLGFGIFNFVFEKEQSDID